MSGLPWIPLDADFPTSRKAVALGIVLQDPKAWAYVVRLWCWCGRNALDGCIISPSAVRELESAAGWNGAEGVLVDALSRSHIRLLDEVPGGFKIHDWDDHCGAHVEKREKDRVRADKNRRGKKRGRTANGSRTEPEPSMTEESRGEESTNTEATTSLELVPTEPSKPPSASPVIAILPCVGTGAKTFNVTEAMADRWQESHPGISVKTEILKARDWLEANSGQRKTPGGCPRFLVNWLNKAQNNGGGYRRPALAPAKTTNPSLPQIPRFT